MLKKHFVEKGVFRQFLEIVYQKIAFFDARSPLKFSIYWRRRCLLKNFRVRHQKMDVSKDYKVGTLWVDRESNPKKKWASASPPHPPPHPQLCPCPLWSNFCAKGKLLKKKLLLGTFWKILTEKLLFFGALSHSKLVHIGAEVAF